MENAITQEKKQNILVSIITVNWNGLEYLKRLFASLQNISYKPVEIILVDNASSDESVHFTRENYPAVKIIRNKQNYMYARGNNEGIREASGEIVCLINNDVEVDPGFIEPVIEVFRNDPTVAACQSKILDLNQPDQFEYAGAAGGFIDHFGYPFMRGRVFFTLEKDHGQYDSDINLFWGSGACLFLRKSALDEVGLLDESFILHQEEIDLCWRLRLQNWNIRFVSRSKVWHKGGGTLSAENPRKVYWNYRNNIFLLVKNLSIVNLIKILTARLFLDSAAFLGELVKGKIRSSLSIIKGYVWVLMHLKLILQKRKSIQSTRKVDDHKIFGLVYPGSIVWEYFVRGRKHFSQLKRINALKIYNS
ncbi:MAG: glycosyltransferase family 2 protein [Calditrichia bacterium]